MNIFKKIQAYLALRSKIAEANALFANDGKRRFVMPVHNSLEVLSVDEALTLKKQGALAADLTRKTIYGACFYWTDTTNINPAAKGKMPKFEMQRRKPYYYKWFEKLHK